MSRRIDSALIMPTEDDKYLTPIEAIRKNCIQCMGGRIASIKECKGKRMCFLYPFRMGKQSSHSKRESEDNGE